MNLLRWLGCTLLLSVLLMLSGCTQVTGTLTGVVKDSVSEYLVRGATITLEDKTVKTNYNGVFTFTDCQIGKYVLTCSSSSYQTKKVGVTVGKGENNVVEIKMTPLPTETLTIDVLDNNNQPMGNTKITVRRENGETQELLTDENGRCTIDLIGGLYYIKACLNQGVSDPLRVIDFPKVKNVVLYCWNFKEEHKFYDDTSKTISVKTPTVAWPAFNIGKSVKYKIFIYKYFFRQNGTKAGGLSFQIYNTTDTSVVLKPLNNGGVYNVYYAVHDAETDQRLAYCDSPSFKVDIKVDNPITTEDWINSLESLLNNMQYAFNLGWDSFAPYCDVISDDYTDSFGKNKITLSNFLKTYNKSVLLNVNSVTPILSGDTLTSATVNVLLNAFENNMGKEESTVVTLTFEKRNGKVQIVKAVKMF